MNAVVKIPLALSVTYLWIGFVCAISFMEAWLKFRAPGVTLPIGLGIGRLVFSALNKAEWVFAITVILSFLFAKQNIFTVGNSFFFLPLVLLILQTVWLLPALDARAEMHIKGFIVPESNLHLYFVIFEIIKVINLFIFSFRLFK